MVSSPACSSQTLLEAASYTARSSNPVCLATSTGTSIWPVTLVIVRIMSSTRSMATMKPMPSSGSPAALSTSVTITMAVPGTPAVPKLPSTEARVMIRYCDSDSSIPVYWAMNTAASAG